MCSVSRPSSGSDSVCVLQLWTDVQSRCGNVGKFSLSRRIRSFNILYVHHEISKRSMEILEKHDVNVLQTISPGAALFYSWVSTWAIVGNYFRQLSSAVGIRRTTNYMTRWRFSRNNKDSSIFFTAPAPLLPACPLTCLQTSQILDLSFGVKWLVLDFQFHSSGPCINRVMSLVRF